jgi:hypothetical protein
MNRNELKQLAVDFSTHEYKAGDYSCRARREENNPAISSNSCMWHDLGVGRSPCAVRSGQGAGDQNAEILGRSGACAVVDRTAAFYVSFVMSMSWG